MIDHVSLGISNLSRAIAFYDQVLAPLGYLRLWTNERGAGYGVAGPDEQLAIFVAGDACRSAGAGTHLALTARSRNGVDEFHRVALVGGAVDEGAPGLRARYGAGYYAAFIRDPDGHKLEAVYHEAVG